MHHAQLHRLQPTTPMASGRLVSPSQQTMHSLATPRSVIWDVQVCRGTVMIGASTADAASAEGSERGTATVMPRPEPPARPLISRHRHASRLYLGAAWRTV
jgi:hypothetical protein